jgi:hypothetical protein
MKQGSLTHCETHVTNDEVPDFSVVGLKISAHAGSRSETVPLPTDTAPRVFRFGTTDEGHTQRSLTTILKQPMGSLVEWTS